MMQRQASAFDDLMTLVWLDLRCARNAFSRIHREPLRAAGWLFWIAFFFWKLVLQPRNGVLHSVADVDRSIDVAAAMLLLVASLSLIRGENPAIAFFSSPLEARWMCGSYLRAWVTIPYLQLRNVFERLPSFAIFLVFILSYCLPPIHSPTTFILGILNVTMLTLCSRMFSLPRELAPLWARIPLIACGYATAAYAIVAGLQAFAGLLLIAPPVLRIFPDLHPGIAFVAGANGNMFVTLAAGFVLSACIVSLVMLCRDRYPELYEISRAGWEVRQRFRDGRRNGGDAIDANEVDQRSLARIPRGAAVLLWTNWQMYRRQQWKYWPLLRPAAGVLFGAFIALLQIAPQTLMTTVGVVFGLTTTFSSLIDAARIGIAVRHPIFWLTQESFTARLTMILFGWYWRSALDIVCFGIGALLGGVSLHIVTSTVAVLVVGIWLQRCIGLAAFAVLPSKTDLGGPTALARFAFAIALAVPPIVVGIIMQTLFHADAIGYVSGSVLALIEAQCLIYLSASLLDGKFDKILTA